MAATVPDAQTPACSNSDSQISLRVGNFGYSYVTTYHLDGNVLSLAQDPACPKVPGNGAFRALNGTVSSGPSDNWLSPHGRFLYQIYGNAEQLVGYATRPDGSLHEVTSVRIPYNSCQGLDGF
jgi:hypothetical protein